MADTNQFFEEEKLDTFDGWLEYQGATNANEGERAALRQVFDELQAQPSPRVGLMKLARLPGEYKYAVAIRDGTALWLTLWVKRSKKGEYFIMMPRGDRAWDPHSSYHLDGTFHMKSFGTEATAMTKQLQPLTSAFHGTEHLGTYAGHGKNIGAVCDPAVFDGVLEVPPNVLGPRNGYIAVDLTEPGHDPLELCGTLVCQTVFRDVEPWLHLRIEA